MSRRLLATVVAALLVAVWGATWAAASPTWVRQASPTPSMRFGSLVAVACPTSTSCWASGYSIDTDVGFPRRLVERYQSGVWSIVVTPGPTSGNTEFQGMACAGVSQCIAVGDHDTGILIDRWNGSTWT